MDNYLASLKDNAGIAGGFQQGIRDRTTQEQSLSNLGRHQAETERYIAQTPDTNRLMAAQARSGELGNMQGEADVQAGVHGATAQKTAAQARLEAQKAMDEYNRWPLEAKKKLHNGVSEASVALLNNLETVLSQTGNIKQAFQIVESEYPDVVKDQGWAMAKQKYGNFPPEQALSEIRQWKAKYASSQAYGDPKFQGDMIKQDAQLGSQERQRQMQADATMGAARERGSTATKPTTAQFIKEQFSTMFPGETDQQIAQRVLLYMKATEQSQEGGLVPEMNPTKRRTPGGMEDRSNPSATKRYNPQTKRWE